VLECYIGDGFWQQVLEPGGEIWTAGQSEVRALTRSRRIALLSSGQPRVFIRLSPRSGSWRLGLRSFRHHEGDQMNVHKNARLTPIGRERIVMQVASGQTPRTAARAAGICPRTVRKWVARYRAEGTAGLADRSLPPRTLHRPTQLLIVDAIIALRPAVARTSRSPCASACHLRPSAAC
jgi:transposase-like protein